MQIVLSGSFCFSEAPWLRWMDVKYGLVHGFLSSAGVVEYATNGLVINSPAEQYELACLDSNNHDDILACVNRLALSDVSDADDAETVWMFLILLWLFKHRSEYEDPLGVVEDIYADFNYPKSMAPIVRYMPAADPSLVGEHQLIINWSNMMESLRVELQSNRCK